MKPLIERIADKWEVISSYEGTKVWGKKRSLKKMGEIIREVESAIEGKIYVYEENKKIKITDSITGVTYTLFKVGQNGRLVINEFLNKIMPFIEDYSFMNKKQANIFFQKLEELRKIFIEVNKEYLIFHPKADVAIRELSYMASWISKR